MQNSISAYIIYLSLSLYIYIWIYVTMQVWVHVLHKAHVVKPQLPSDPVKCHSCQGSFFSEAWTQEQRHNIRMSRLRVRCASCQQNTCAVQTCTERVGNDRQDDAVWHTLPDHERRQRELVCRTRFRKGFTAADTVGVECAKCKERLGERWYNKKGDVQCGQGSCGRSRIACSRCEKIGGPADDVQAKNWRARGRYEKAVRMCEDCSAGGYTPKDGSAYECRYCRSVGGIEKFDKKSVNNAKSSADGKRQLPFCNRRECMKKALKK